MDDDNLIKYRNRLTVKGLWLFLCLDIPLNFLLKDYDAAFAIFITVFLPILVITYMVKKQIKPKWTMYSILFVFIAVLIIINLNEPHYINLFLLILPPIFSVSYRNWLNILITTIGSAVVFSYFQQTNGPHYYYQWKPTDLYYFLIFFLTYAILKIYETNFTEGIRIQLCDELNRVNLLTSKLHESEEEQKEIEKAFKENEAIYRIIADNMSDFVTVLDTKGKILYASPSHENSLNIKLSEIEGKTPFEFIHPDDVEKVHHALEKMVKNKNSIQIELRWKVGTEWIYLEVRGRPVEEANGEIHSVVVTSRNITERVKMEKEIRRTSARLEALISHMPYGILAEDKDSRLILLNHQFTSIFHASAISENMLGMRPDDLQIQPGNLFLDEKLYDKRSKEILKNREKVLGEEWELKDGRIISRDAIPIIINDQFDGFLWQFKDTTEQRKLEQSLKEASVLDGLTKISNRRFFDETILTEWGRSSRVSKPLTLVMLDIDCFKNYNDTYGHQHGDECLIQVAQTIKETLRRPSDVVCRYGGEEFAVILSDTHMEGGMVVAEKIRNAIEALNIPHITSIVSDYVTSSLGVATVIPSFFSTPNEIIRMADNALYTSKKSGRNCVSLYHRDEGINTK